MNVGDKVRVVGQDGNVLSEGVYHGTGIPKAALKAKHPTYNHFAIMVEGETALRYYPVGFHTLILSRK